MKIAFCDDDKEYLEEIRRNVEAILSEQNINAQFDLFSNSSELYNCDGFYDMTFLDIEMETYSGIEVAKKLKTINPYIIVFIITSYDRYLDDAMDLNVFRYIKKPLDYKRLKNGIIKALGTIDSQNITFVLKNNSKTKTVLADDIVFIETSGRATRVVTVNDEFMSENKMEFWKSKLIASFFYNVHKSFIINVKHISDYKRDTVTLLEKYNIPVAYRKQAEFRGFFFRYFGGR